MSIYSLGIAVLAVWRITHLLAEEDGPFQLVARLRKRLGAGFWGGLMDCFNCLSLWVALPFAAASAGALKQRVILWPALSGAAILLNRLYREHREVEYFESEKENS
jgi:hypothetical protein